VRTVKNEKYHQKLIIIKKMPHIVTETKIRKTLEDKGYKLIKYNGLGRYTKHSIECPIGHQNFASYDCFSRDRYHCCECNLPDNVITEEKFRKLIEEEKYQLIQFNGNGYQTKHITLCPFGHEYLVNWQIFKMGSRCSECASHIPITEQDFKTVVEEEKYQLLQYNGIGNQTRHLTLCPEGHEYLASWTSFTQGDRCSECNGNARITEVEFKETIEEEGYKLLRHNGFGNKVKHLTLCPEGHEWEICYKNFVLGHRCSHCNGNAFITEQEFKETIEREGYKLLRYNGRGNKVNHLILCPKGHEWMASYNRFKNRGCRCSECIIFYSELECKNIFEKILSPYKFVKVKPSFLHGLELDGYCEEIQIAFEYNGEQHYRFVPFYFKTEENFERQKERDQRKERLCNEEGIFLCVIPYTYNHRESEKMEKFIRNWIISPVFDDKGGRFFAFAKNRISRRRNPVFL
jgi:lysozyme family protein